MRRCLVARAYSPHLEPPLVGVVATGKFSFNSSNLFIKYAFEIAKADAVHLNVFPENPSAKKCYEKAGFKERTLTENAFSFKDESWGRCNMITTR